jgi:hypothetical protein
MQRVTDLADPHRCKGSKPDGQCQNVAEEGSDYCIACGGVDHAPARRLKEYLITKVADQVRLAQLAENDGLKSLREEVAVALGMLERRLGLVKTDVEFLTAFPQIERFFKTLADLKKANLSLEQKTGAMLSRSAVLRLGQQLCQIIVDELDGIPNYEQIVDRILTKFVPAIERADNSEPETNLR